MHYNGFSQPQGITHSLHYLDDFIMVTDSIGKAHFQKDTFTSTFDSLGVPLEYFKLEGPSTCLTFLGIEVDTEALSYLDVVTGVQFPNGNYRV